MAGSQSLTASTTASATAAAPGAPRWRRPHRSRASGLPRARARGRPAATGGARARPPDGRRSRAASTAAGRLGALQPDPQGAYPPEGEPGLPGAGDRAVQAPVSRECLVQVWIRRDGGTQDDVGVPGEVLGDGVDHHVGAEVERTLDERCGERVVHHRDRTVLSRRGEAGRQVRDLQQGVGGGLEPEQGRAVGPAPGEGGADGRGVGDVDATRAEVAPARQLVGQLERRVVGRVGDEEKAARGDAREDRGDRRHARREEQRPARALRYTLEPADDLLARGPGGVVDPAVHRLSDHVRAGADVGGGHRHPGSHLGTRSSLGPPGGDGCRLRVQVLVGGHGCSVGAWPVAGRVGVR